MGSTRMRGNSYDSLFFFDYCYRAELKPPTTMSAAAASPATTGSLAGADQSAGLGRPSRAATDSAQDFSTLLEAVQDAWSDQFDIDAFRRRIRQYRASLARPLEKERSAELPRTGRCPQVTRSGAWACGA